MTGHPTLIMTCPNTSFILFIISEITIRCAFCPNTSEHNELSAQLLGAPFQAMICIKKASFATIQKLVFVFLVINNLFKHIFSSTSELSISQLIRVVMLMSKINKHKIYSGESGRHTSLQISIHFSGDSLITTTTTHPTTSYQLLFWAESFCPTTDQTNPQGNEL